MVTVRVTITDDFLYMTTLCDVSWTVRSVRTFAVIRICNKELT